MPCDCFNHCDWLNAWDTDGHGCTRGKRCSHIWETQERSSGPSLNMFSWNTPWSHLCLGVSMQDSISLVKDSAWLWTKQSSNGSSDIHFTGGLGSCSWVVGVGKTPNQSSRTSNRKALLEPLWAIMTHVMASFKTLRWQRPYSSRGTQK